MIGIECNDAIGIQIVALPAAAVVVGTWIPHWPVDQVRFRIKRSGQPGGATPGFQGTRFPGLCPWLSGLRNGVEAPDLFASRCIPSINESANAVFTSGNTGDHDMLQCQRSTRNAVARLGVGDFDIPEDLAGL